MVGHSGMASASSCTLPPHGCPGGRATLQPIGTQPRTPLPHQLFGRVSRNVAAMCYQVSLSTLLRSLRFQVHPGQHGGRRLDEASPEGSPGYLWSRPKTTCLASQDGPGKAGAKKEPRTTVPPKRQAAAGPSSAPQRQNATHPTAMPKEVQRSPDTEPMM